MLRRLIDLIRFAAGPDARHMRPWAGRQLLTTGAEFMSLYAQVAALDGRRLGHEAGPRLLLMFVLGIALFLGTRERLHVDTARCLARRGAAFGKRLFGRLRRLPLIRLDAMHPAGLADHLIDDLSQVMNAAAALVDTPRALLRVLLGSALMFAVSPPIAWVALAGLVALIGLLIGQQALLSAGHEGLADVRRRTVRLMRGHLGGAAMIKQHAARSAAIGRVLDGLSARLRSGRSAMYGTFYARGHAATLVLYGLLGVNMFVLPGLLDQEARAALAINFVILWLVFSVTTLSATLPELAEASAAFGRLADLEARLEDAELEPAHDPADDRFDGFERVALSGVGFAYPRREGRSSFGIEPLDVELRRGEVIFVTGHNGSGKSTFLRLLTGLYAPLHGAVEVDGRPIGPGDVVAYRRLFSTIFTDHHLFGRAYGITPERIAAEAPPLLESMGLAHKTGFDGQTITRLALSAGQRKRLAMVLARLSDRPILIFDEWAADQDPEFRAAFYNEHLPAMRRAGKLVIAVTHDDNYFHLCDRRLHFADGRLVEVTR